jgi:hypothetical protein
LVVAVVVVVVAIVVVVVVVVARHAVAIIVDFAARRAVAIDVVVVVPWHDLQCSWRWVDDCFRLLRMRGSGGADGGGWWGRSRATC